MRYILAKSDDILEDANEIEVVSDALVVCLELSTFNYLMTFPRQ
jgi:hypothetical protein